MTTRLSDATPEELNAAFDAVEAKLDALITNFVPMFFRSQAMQQLHSPQGTAMLLDAIDTAIDAVEEVRKRKLRKK